MVEAGQWSTIRFVKQGDPFVPTLVNISTGQETHLSTDSKCFCPFSGSNLRFSSLYEFIYNMETERLDTDTLWQIYVLERGI